MKNYKIQLFRSIALMILVSTGLFVTTAMKAQSAQILHNPSQVEVLEGDTFEVTVEIHSGAQPIAVADFHMVFNPDHLKVLEVNAVSGSPYVNSIQPSFNNVDGTISMGSFQFGGQAPSGFIEAMQVTFMALLETEITSVEHPADIFPKSILAYAGEDYLGNVGPLNISILPGNVVSNNPELQAVELSLEIWPNPATEQTTVTFRAENTGEASLEVFDVSGKKVSELYRGTAISGAIHHFDIDVRSLENGLYLCKLKTKHGSKTKRLVVTK